MGLDCDTIKIMSVARRSFMTASAAGFVAAIQPPGTSAAPMDPRLDPLGVRADFPVVDLRIYLNSAYIAPVHREGIVASHAHLEAKSKGSLNVGSLIRTNTAVRVQFARMINATPEEIAARFRTPVFGDS